MSCPAGYSVPRVAPFAAATETYEPGQRINFYGGVDIIWTENHLPASRLEPLRSLGDPLADDALAALDIKPGEDTLEALLAYTSQPNHEQRSPAPQQLLTQVMTVPDWIDWDSIQRGQQVFWRYVLYAGHVLGHAALPGGFAIPKTMKVLATTGYLVGPNAIQRLLESVQFMFGWFHSPDNLQPGSGIAWKSIVQIRFLHSAVRARLLKFSRAHPEYHNLKDYGVPINQEDLLAVLFGLSSGIWWGLELKMDVHMTTREREDYMHVWRYVGYMMGVDDILCVTQTPERAQACLESILLHLVDPNDEGRRLGLTALEDASADLNLFFKITKATGLLDLCKLNMALVENLVGSELLKEQGFLPASRRYRVYRKVIMYHLTLDLWLVSKSSRWLRIRSSLIRMVVKAKTTTKQAKQRNKRTKSEQKELPEECDKHVTIKMTDDTFSGRL